MPVDELHEVGKREMSDVLNGGELVEHSLTGCPEWIGKGLHLGVGAGFEIQDRQAIGLLPRQVMG
jgi:hypothetical protein